jgi:hypothetical protein
MALDSLITFLRRLNEAGIHYSVGSFRDSVNVLVTTPTNERWEVEFFADGGVEVERFVSQGVEAGEAKLDELFEQT